ncbi:ATP-binding protein [Phaeobacter sp.]|uniref:ATP-binding protein n=1 Tax=Phaeobacter sp. TaxID=1902409 RepID=UPI0025D5ED07|nr:ATP-binding protein [Phaeobacter sp.]
MTLIPRSLAGYLIASTVVATVLTQTLISSVFLIYQDAKFDKFEDLYFYQKIISTAEYLRSAPTATHRQILETASNDETTYTVATAPKGTLPLPDTTDAMVLRDHFGDQNVLTEERTINIKDLLWILFGDAAEVCVLTPGTAPEILASDCPFVTISVQLDDGSWLNVRTFANADISVYLAPFALSVLTSLLGIGGSVTILARKITRPLRDLSHAAEQLGRGETTDPIPVSGPAEVAKTADAFNRMQERLTRFVRDRTTMLAAINHDLRTPLTSLRLRAEFIEQDGLRADMIETTEEMRAMVDSYLAFSFQEAAEEDLQPVDLGAVLQDLTAQEPDVDLRIHDSCVSLCHPVSIKRVFRNLIGNGIKYGDRVQIALRCVEDQICLDFQDDGPGIPAQMAEEVFTPFTRLDHSRDVSDGSVGLGLSIARSIVRRRGGDVFPITNENGRFAMRVILPHAGLPAKGAG